MNLKRAMVSMGVSAAALGMLCFVSCAAAQETEPETGREFYAETAQAGMDFFAKNMETGEVISSADLPEGQTTMNAGRPGGSGQEKEHSADMRGSAVNEILNAGKAFDLDSFGQIEMNTVFGSDDRIWLDYNSRASYPYRAVVSAVSWFPNGDCRVGTAVVVDHHTLLTCGHCVYDPDRGGWADAVDLIPGRDNDSWPYGSTYASYMVVPGSYYNNLEWTWDIAVLNTPDDLGSVVGWFGMSWQGASLQGEDVYTIGYPASTMAEMQTSGRIETSATEYFLFTMDTSGGQSGSPIYRWESDGWPHILGIVRGEDNTTNYGVRLTEDKFDWIMAKAY